jgi:hypothetical protein
MRKFLSAPPARGVMCGCDPDVSRLATFCSPLPRRMQPKINGDRAQQNAKRFVVPHGKIPSQLLSDSDFNFKV